MHRRDYQARPRLSERLRRSTEERWTDDPRLSDAGGGPGCDDCWTHEHHDHHHGGIDGLNEDDGGEEWV